MTCSTPTQRGLVYLPLVGQVRHILSSVFLCCFAANSHSAPLHSGGRVAHTGTITIGLSCELDRFFRAYGFFVSGLMHATTTAQMMLRCRRITSVILAYQGAPNRYMPTTLESLARWFTSASGPDHRDEIPDGLRHDRSALSSGLQTASDPNALLEAVGQTFQGLFWINDQLVRFRSASNFLDHLDFVLQRGGIKLEDFDDSDDVAQARSPDARVTREAAATSARAAHGKLRKEAKAKVPFRHVSPYHHHKTNTHLV